MASYTVKVARSDGFIHYLKPDKVGRSDVEAITIHLNSRDDDDDDVFARDKCQVEAD